nr:hypothetical protein [Acidisphaera sp. L21]
MHTAQGGFRVASESRQQSDSAPRKDSPVLHFIAVAAHDEPRTSGVISEPCCLS